MLTLQTLREWLVLLTMLTDYAHIRLVLQTVPMLQLVLLVLHTMPTLHLTCHAPSWLYRSGILALTVKAVAIESTIAIIPCTHPICR